MLRTLVVIAGVLLVCPSGLAAEPAPAVSLTLIPPSPVSDRIAIDIRGAVWNREETARAFEVSIYLDEERPEHLLKQTSVTVAPERPPALPSVGRQQAPGASMRSCAWPAPRIAQRSLSARRAAAGSPFHRCPLHAAAWRGLGRHLPSRRGRGRALQRRTGQDDRPAVARIGPRHARGGPEPAGHHHDVPELHPSRPAQDRKRRLPGQGLLPVGTLSRPNAHRLAGPAGDDSCRGRPAGDARHAGGGLLRLLRLHAGVAGLAQAGGRRVMAALRPSPVVLRLVRERREGRRARR